MIARLDNVTRTYRNGEGVFELSLGIPGGQVIGLLGLNGSGKTTTMKLISGLLRPAAGEITVRDGPPRAQRRHVAWLGDRMGFPTWMSPRHVAGFMGALFRDFRPDVYQTLLDRLEIPAGPLSNMSRGQQQKLKLAATMARDTDLYLLDEPLSGVDLITRTSILQNLPEFRRQGASVMISTHEIRDAEPILDRALFLQDGRLRGDLTAQDLQAEGRSVSDAFLQILGNQEGKEGKWR